MAGRFDETDYGRIQTVRDFVQDLSVAKSKDTPYELKVAGDFIYLSDDTTGKIYIRLNDKDAPRIPAQAGFSLSGVTFARLFIDWEAQSGASAQIFHGLNAHFAPTNDIANIGTVTTLASLTSFVDRDSAGGNHFLGGYGVGASVGNYGQSMIWNPAASGVTLAVRKIKFSALSANVGAYLQRLTAIMTNGPSTYYGNKKLDGSAPLAKIYNQVAAGAVGTLVSEAQAAIAGETINLVLGSPIIVPESYGIGIMADSTNQSVYVSFEWEEY